MSTVIGQIVDWGILEADELVAGGHIEDNNDAFAKKAFAAEDNGKRLAVQISVKEAGEDVKKNSCGHGEPFTFVSSNDDKLIVNENTGDLYPGKEAVNGKVYVHVYYDGSYVGSCDVTIYAKRIFSGFTAEISDTKLHYNSVGTMGVDEELTITLKPVDQLGDLYNNANMTLTAELMNADTASQYVTLTGSGITWKVKAAADSRLTSTISSFRILCTGEYDDNQTPKITKRYTVSFTAKDTKDQLPKDYQIVANYPEWWNYGKVDMNLGDVANKTVSLSAYSYDKDGFKIQKLDLNAGHSAAVSTVAGDATIVIQLGRDYVGASNFEKDGDVLKFKTVLDHQTETISTVSGSAIVAEERTDVVKKIKEGVYSAYLFIGDGTKAAYKKSLAIQVYDSQPKVNFNWKKYSTSLTVADKDDIAGVLAVVKDCITFTYPNAWSYVTDDIYINEGDYTLKGTSLQIHKVRYLIPIGDQVFEQIINVERTVRIGAINN